MASLTRWDPFREMMTLRSTMDRLFDDTMRSMGTGEGQSASSLALDVSENEGEYVVKASLPGIPEEELNVTLNNGVLSISGEFKAEEEKQDTRYHLRERRFGSFSRSISLPANVDEEAISASFEHGVLTVQLPKAEEAKPKRIAVQGRKTIEGQSQNGQSSQAQTGKLDNTAGSRAGNKVDNEAGENA